MPHPGPPNSDRTSPTGPLREPTHDRSAPHPGAIGPYRVLRRIASGGMGDVFECLDPALDRRVAVKVAHPALASQPSAFAHIRDEGKRLASIKDRSFVLPVLAAGDVEINGVTVPYIAMEFADDAEELGGPASSAWPIERKIEFFVKLCSGVQAMHDQHLVHADLKPANILVVRSGGGEPRIIDFGIARVVRRAGGHSDQLVGGTPDYFDPALSSNPDARPDHRTDIYCLGLTLAAFLSGRTPTPDWPTADRPPSALAPSIPRDLDAVILRAIAPDPAARYQSAADLARALDAWLAARRTFTARCCALLRERGGGLAITALRTPLLAIALCALFAAGTSAAIFHLALSSSALAHWAQRLARPSVETVLAPTSFSSLRVIHVAEDDIPAIVAAARDRGLEIPIDAPGGSRLMYAAIADKLVESSGISAVGLDIFIDEPKPPFDALLRQSLERLARASSAGAVAIGLEHWQATSIPELSSPEFIRAVCLSMHSADDAGPAIAHLARLPAGDDLARPSFCVTLACLAQRPRSGPQLRLSDDQTQLIIDAFRTDSDGTLVRNPEPIVLSHVQIGPGNKYPRSRAAEGDRIAALPLAVAPPGELERVTKRASEVLRMPADTLRTWHAGLPILIARTPENQFRSADRTVWGFELQAAAVEKLLSARFLRLPDLRHAFTLLIAIALLAATATWLLLSRLPRRSLPVPLLLGGSIVVLLAFLAGSGGLLYARELRYFINPLPLAMAAAIASLLVTVLCVARPASASR